MKAPKLAAVLAADPMGPGDGELEHNPDEADGGDDRDAAVQAAGEAALEAFHAKDAAAFMRAIAAGVKAQSGDDEEPETDEAAE